MTNVSSPCSLFVALSKSWMWFTTWTCLSMCLAPANNRHLSWLAVSKISVGPYGALQPILYILKGALSFLACHCNAKYDFPKNYSSLLNSYWAMGPNGDEKVILYYPGYLSLRSVMRPSTVWCNGFVRSWVASPSALSPSTLLASPTLLSGE